MPISDSSTTPLTQHLEDSYNFIYNALFDEKGITRSDTGVLVHCQMGQSRSAAIGISFPLKKPFIYFLYLV